MSPHTKRKVNRLYKRNLNKTLKKKLNKNRIFIIPGKDKTIQASIDTAAVKHNIAYLRHSAKTDIMPVLKADAYGHGLTEMAKTVRKLGVKYIGVATLGEAILLRESGDTGRILAWLYDIESHEIKDALQLDIDIAICDETIIPRFIKMIPAGKVIKTTIFVDTGINRAGIPYEKALQAFLDVHACAQIELVGMMSHLVSSQIKNSPIVHEQLRKFRALRDQLATLNIKPPLIHIANTYACLNYDVSDFTLARSGGGIYGIPSVKRDPNLKLAMTIKSYIIQLKDIAKGQGIGYDWKYITPKKMRIAVVPIGYTDIIPREASLKMHLYINGTKRKVLGLISMDQIIVEAKKSDKIKNDVFIFGNGTNCPQTIYDIAKNGNSSAYEVICRVGYRVNRVYI